MNRLQRRQDQAKQDRRGVMMIAGCVLALAAVGGVLVINQPPARDLKTGCLRTPLAETTTAIIDMTDPMSAAERSLLRGAILQLANTTPTEGKLTLIPFTGSGEAVPEPLFSKCRPPEGKHTNTLFATAAKADKTFGTTFAAPLAKTIDQLTQGGNAKQTHLVQFLATSAGALNYQGAGEKKKRLRLYSDMAEHGAEGSLLGKQALDERDFATYFKERVGDRLKGIELEIVVTPSPSTPPAVRKRLEATWRAALKANNVSFNWERL